MRSYRFKSQEIEYVHFFTLMKCTWIIKCIFCYSIQKSAWLSYINLVYNLIVLFFTREIGNLGGLILMWDEMDSVHYHHNPKCIHMSLLYKVSYHTMGLPAALQPDGQLN